MECSTELGEAISALQARKDQVATSHCPSRLPLDQIEIREDVFQARHEELSERHLSDLKRALAAPQDLDPITVTAIGEKFVLVDGHHRIEAYHRAGRSNIPVTYFEGSVQDAVLKSAELNSLAKLPMTNAQRQNCAWRLVRTDLYSKSAIAKAASVSTGQVANMRRAKRLLGTQASEFDTWWMAKEEANALVSGEERAEFTADDLEERAERLADDILKAISMHPSRNPELLAKAISIYAGKNARYVAEELAHLCPPEDAMEDHEDGIADY